MTDRHPYAQKGLNQANFADDTMTWSANRDAKHIIKNIGNGLHAAHEWGKKNGMQFSFKKCNVLFWKKTKKTPVPKIYFNRPGETTCMKLKSNNFDPENEPERSSTYLGQNFTQKLDHVKEMTMV